MLEEYRNRIADALLVRKLAGKGAVLIEGPKWCGKTTTAEQHARSVIYMADNKRRNTYLELADIDPDALLDGDTPHLIDEWQIAPTLWDAVRFAVDHRKGLGHFILTGSAVPADTKDIVHTGTGRFSWLMMRPMTLWESGDSNGKVSLGNMFSRPERITATNKLNLRQVAFLTCRGGWPQAVNLDGIIALDQARDYYDAVVKQDINRVDGVNRDSTRVKQLMRSYARNQGAQASLSLIRQDMLTNDTEELSIETVNSYIKALKKIFVIEDMPAWNPNLRSKTAIRTSDTRYFVDPSIAAASLGVGPEDLLNDLNSFGLLFEALCVRDLRVFAQVLDGEVYHYRDKSGLECDTVVHLRNGSYGLIEIKLGGDRRIEEGVLTLKDLASKIDTERMKEPSFLMILTAVGDYAYRRKDGVYIVPIGCLKN
jgi:predicted AAA+ superfamily ATPase